MTFIQLEEKSMQAPRARSRRRKAGDMRSGVGGGSGGRTELGGGARRLGFVGPFIC